MTREAETAAALTLEQLDSFLARKLGRQHPEASLARLLLILAARREAAYGRAETTVWHERLNGACAVVAALAVGSGLSLEDVAVLVSRARREGIDLDVAAPHLDAMLREVV